MTRLTHKRARVNGVRLHYVTVGKGPVVLCMHGCAKAIAASAEGGVIECGHWVFEKQSEYICEQLVSFWENPR